MVCIFHRSLVTSCLRSRAAANLSRFQASERLRRRSLSRCTQFVFFIFPDSKALAIIGQTEIPDGFILYACTSFPFHTVRGRPFYDQDCLPKGAMVIYAICMLWEFSHIRFFYADWCFSLSKLQRTFDWKIVVIGHISRTEIFP